MIRAALLALMLASPLWAGPQAQPELPQEQVQAGLEASFGATGRLVDHIRGWHVDWNNDGTPEVLAQVSYANPAGGNSVVIEWVIVALQGGAIVQVARFELPGFIDAVYDQPELVALSLLTYGPEDPRCCPSVQLQHWLPKP